MERMTDIGIKVAIKEAKEVLLLGGSATWAQALGAMTNCLSAQVEMLERAMEAPPTNVANVVHHHHYAAAPQVDFRGIFSGGAAGSPVSNMQGEGGSKA
jgi:hypothetical protein